MVVSGASSILLHVGVHMHVVIRFLESLSSPFVPAYFHTSWLLSRCCPTSALPERMVFTRLLVDWSAIEASKKVESN